MRSCEAAVAIPPGPCRRRSVEDGPRGNVELRPADQPRGQEHRRNVADLEAGADKRLEERGAGAGNAQRHTGAAGRGVLCTSDMATVNTDRSSFTFMRSYPNMIPLSARQVEAIGAALDAFAFDRVYSHFFDRVIASDAKAILRRSVARYVGALGGAYDGR